MNAVNADAVTFAFARAWRSAERSTRRPIAHNRMIWGGATRARVNPPSEPPADDGAALDDALLKTTQTPTCAEAQARRTR